MLEGEAIIYLEKGSALQSYQIPAITIKGILPKGWDKDISAPIYADTNFTAEYDIESIKCTLLSWRRGSFSSGKNRDIPL